MASSLSRVARRAGFGVLMLLAPAVIFRSFFHWEILLPTNIAWLMEGDRGANALGWNAFRHDVWGWPLGETKLLAWPTGATVGLTDSNPLLSLLLKPFAPILPEPFQFIGPWLLACLVLHFFAAYALMRHASPDRWLRLLGATLLTLLPTLIHRALHPNLFAHWTILVSLHLFLNVQREARRDLGFAAVLIVCALVHPYLLLMNAAVWSADVLRRGWSAIRVRDPLALALLAARSAVIATAPLAAFLAVNGLGRYEGDPDGFGRYSMALDALINPGLQPFSQFLVAAPQGDGQLYEGFQYLGAGLLFLIAAAGVSALVAGRAHERLRRLAWLVWLGPGLLVLCCLALSDDIQWHAHRLAHVSYDWAPLHLTDLFRASGRLFWPCAYVLVLAALELVSSLNWTAAMALGLAALGVQVVDLTGFATLARAHTQRAATVRGFQRAVSPAWDQLIASADLVQFEPPEPLADDRLFYEVAWRATSLRRPVNVMYTARLQPRQQALQEAAHTDFVAGRLDPDRLYVLVRGCLPPDIDAGRAGSLDGVSVIAPARAGPALAKLAPPKAFPLGRAAPVRGAAGCLLGAGWSAVEDWGVWSDGPLASLALRVDPSRTRDLLLTVSAQPFPRTGQAVSVQVAGREVGRWLLRGEVADYRVRIPRALVPTAALTVTLAVERPTAPRDLGPSRDDRRLGIGLVSVRLDEVD